MMMGTAGELAKEPTQKAVFVEDMTDAELSKAVSSFYYHAKRCI